MRKIPEYDEWKKIKTSAGISPEEYKARTDLYVEGLKLDKALRRAASATDKVYSGWQKKEDMEKYSAAVNDAALSLKGYMDRLQRDRDKLGQDTYTKAYESTDKLLKTYDQLSRQVGKMSLMYSDFCNADEYGQALKEAEWREKYKGNGFEQLKKLVSDTSLPAEERDWIDSYADSIRRSDEVETKWGAVRKNSDFALKSRYIPEQKSYTDEEMTAAGWKQAGTGEWYKPYGMLGSNAQWFSGDINGSFGADKDDGYIYNYINSPEFRKAHDITLSDTSYGVYRTSDFTGYDLLTDDEVGLYNYLRSTRGGQKALEYLDDLKVELGYRQLQQERERSVAAAKESPVGASLYTLGSNVINGIMFPAKIAAAAFGEYESNPWLDRYGVQTEAMRGQVARQISNSGDLAGTEILGQPLGGFVYKTLMGVADTLVATGIGAGAAGGAGKTARGIAGLISSSATGSSAMMSARQRGLDDWQSVALGMGAVGIDILADRYSLEKILPDPTGAAQYLAYNLMNSVGQSAASGIAESLLDVLVTGDESEITEEYSRLIRNGLTSGQATREVLMQRLQSMGSDMLGSAMSSVLKSAPKAVGMAVSDYVSGRNALKNSDVYDAGGLIPEAAEFAREYENSAVAKLAAKAEKRRDMGNANPLKASAVGRLARNYSTSLRAEISDANSNLIRSGIKDSIGYLDPSADAERLSETAMKVLRQQSLTGREAEALENSPAAQQVILQAQSDLARQGGFSDRQVYLPDNADPERERLREYSDGLAAALNPEGKASAADRANAPAGQEGTGSAAGRAEARAGSGSRESLPDKREKQRKSRTHREYAAEIQDKDVAAAYLESAQPAQDPDRYAAEWKLYQTAGTAGIPISAAGVRDGILTKSQQAAAYAAGELIRSKKAADSKGRIDRAVAEMRKSDPEFNPGKFSDASILDSYDSMDDDKRAVLTWAKGVAAATGVDIVMFDSAKKSGKGYHNGDYDSRTNRIYLDVNADAEQTEKTLRDNLAPALSRDITGRLQQQAPLEYQALKESVSGFLQSGDYQPAVRGTEDEYFHRDISGGQISDGAVARVCSDMLADPQVLESFMSRVGQSRSRLQVYGDVVDSRITRVREVFGRILSQYSTDSKEVGLVRESDREAARIQQRFDASFSAAAQAEGRQTEDAAALPGSYDGWVVLDDGKKVRYQLKRTSDGLPVLLVGEKDFLSAPRQESGKKNGAGGQKTGEISGKDTDGSR